MPIKGIGIEDVFRGDFSVIKNIGKIGCFGDLRFEILPFKILSPTKGLGINKGADFSEHQGINSAPTLEFNNRKLRKVSMKIKLLITYSDVRGNIEKITRMVENGEAYPLIIGNESYSPNLFVISDFSENKNGTDSRGNSINSELDLNFVEYIPEIDRGSAYSQNVEQQWTEGKKVSDVEENNKSAYEEVDKRLW